MVVVELAVYHETLFPLIRLLHVTPLLQDPALVMAEATLPTWEDHAGRWRSVGGSASAWGLSGRPGVAQEPSLVAGANSLFAAWSDTRHGNFEIFAAVAGQFREGGNGFWLRAALADN